MNRIRKLIHGVLALLTALTMLAGTMTAANAAEAGSLDFSQSGSVSLTLVDGDGNPVSGGTISIYEVAALYLDNGEAAYDYTDAFINCTAVPDITDTSLAETLAEYAADYDITGTDMSVGADGTVTFDGLELGLYLVVQTEESAHYETINPFVVTVPMESDGVWVYDVDASPKVGAVTAIVQESQTPASEDDTPTDTTTTDTTTDTTTNTTTGTTGGISAAGRSGSSSLPQTGQLNWPIPVMAACGLILFVTGCVLNNTEKKKQHYAS